MKGRWALIREYFWRRAKNKWDYVGQRLFLALNLRDVGALFFQVYTIGTKPRLFSGKQGCFSSSLLLHDTFQCDRIFRAYFKWNDFLREFAEERWPWRSRVQLRKGLWPRLPCLQIIFSHFRLHESTSQGSEWGNFSTNTVQVCNCNRFWLDLFTKTCKSRSSGTSGLGTLSKWLDPY